MNSCPRISSSGLHRVETIHIPILPCLQADKPLISFFLLGIAAFSNIPASHVLDTANQKALAYFLQNKNAPFRMAFYHKPQPFLPGVPCGFLYLESGSTSLRLFIILRRYHPTIKKRLLPCQKRSNFCDCTSFYFSRMIFAISHLCRRLRCSQSVEVSVLDVLPLHFR